LILFAAGLAAHLAPFIRWSSPEPPAVRAQAWASAGQAALDAGRLVTPFILLDQWQRVLAANEEFLRRLDAIDPVSETQHALLEKLKSSARETGKPIHGGLIGVDMGQFERTAAGPLFRAALQIDPENAEARAGLAETVIRLNAMAPRIAPRQSYEGSSAALLFLGALEFDPANPESKRGLRVLSHRLVLSSFAAIREHWDYDGALKLLNEAHEIDPENREAEAALQAFPLRPAVGTTEATSVIDIPDTSAGARGLLRNIAERLAQLTDATQLRDRVVEAGDPIAYYRLVLAADPKEPRTDDAVTALALDLMDQANADLRDTQFAQANAKLGEIAGLRPDLDGLAAMRDQLCRSYPDCRL
jgi:tetratricopeptide (TPR) repeat protein